MTPEITTPFALLAGIAGLAYLLGAVPFGIVMARLFGLGDLRSIGSGNIGATNVLRTGSKPAAFLTLILDAGKGAIAVLLARFFIGEDAAQLAGFAAFLGHLYPVWLGFRGGKGVATYLGTLIALDVTIGALACLVWLITALITRISSLSALISAALVPFILFGIGPREMILLSLLLAGLIWLRHTENIARIAKGSEPRIGAKKA